MWGNIDYLAVNEFFHQTFQFRGHFSGTQEKGLEGQGRERAEGRIVPGGGRHSRGSVSFLYKVFFPLRLEQPNPVLASR